VITLAICRTLVGSITRNSIPVCHPAPDHRARCDLLAAISSAQGAAFAQTILPIVIFATLLQLGYLGTALFKHAVLPDYSGERPASLGTPRLR